MWQLFGVKTFSLVVLATLISLTACRSTATVAAADNPKKTFASAEHAGNALLQAVKSGNQASLLEIFGPDGKEILFSTDSASDARARQDFVAAYESMHRWGKISGGGQMLYIGNENFPFPVPLLQDSSGQWYFSTDNGRDELLARRIGKDELIAMAALVSLANAEELYFNEANPNNKQYAQKFVSDEGKHNGLYWPATGTQDQSPLARLGDFAEGAGFTKPGQKPQPFNGYNFRILTQQAATDQDAAMNYIVNGKMTKGFAILAYPAKYQESGIMTFMIGKDGILYEKDLGKATVERAQAITQYNPRDGWKRVND